MKRIFFLRNRLNLILAILLFSSTSYFTFTKEHKNYRKYRDVLVRVLDHQRDRGSLYLVVSSKDWGIFDIKVSPAAYSTSRAGDSAIFSLREMDIKYNFWKNFGLMVWIGSCVFSVAYLLIFLPWFYFIGYKSWDKDTGLGGNLSLIVSAGFLS